jgi:hypothetical protein
LFRAKAPPVDAVADRVQRASAPFSNAAAAEALKGENLD